MLNKLKRIEYLESSGTQYLDTGVFIDATNLTVEIEAMFLNSDTNYLAGGFDGTNYYGLRPDAGGTNLLAWHPGVSAIYGIEYDYVNKRLPYKFENGNLYIDDILITAGEGLAIDRTLYLFGRNGSTAPDALATCRIYSCKIYQNKILIRDFVPVLDNNNVACLYDIVNSKIYYNLSGTLFDYDENYTGFEEDLYFPVKKIYAGIDEELEIVDYVESTGSQYIDTGILITPQTGFEIDFMTSSPLSNSNGSFGTIIGGRISSSVNEINVSTYINSTVTTGTLRYGSSTYEANLTANSRIKCSLKNGVYTNKDGTATTLSMGTFNPIRYTLTLFALNESGVVSQHSRTKIFSCKIYEGDILVRDFIPVKTSNGIYCLYDNVTKKKFLNKDGGRLQGGVINKPLEYLESTGDQYINTGIIPNSTTKVIIDMQFTKTDKYQMMGWGSSGDAETFFWGAAVSEGFSSNVNSTWEAKYANVPIDKERHIFELSSGSQKLDGIEYGTSVIGNTAESGQYLYLFGTLVEWTSVINYLCHVKIYSCQIYNGTTLVRDFIPYSDTNGKKCLYDKVNSVYYYNSGKGSFLGKEKELQKKSLKNIAKEINKIYAGIDENLEVLDYIESTGSQYIDTGLNLPDGYKAEIECIAIGTSSTYMAIIGEEASADPYYRNFLMFHTEKNWSLGAYANYRGGAWDTDIKYNINFSTVKGEVSLTVNNELILSNTDNEKRAGNRIYMFALGHNGGAATFFAKIRMYKAKIYSKNNELLRDFIPVKTSKGIICLYDKVTKELFYSKGTKNFLGGYINTKLKYLEANGSQYIDTGVKNSANIRVVSCLSFSEENAFTHSGTEVGGANGRFKWGHNGENQLGIGWGSNYYNYTVDTSKDSVANYHIFDLMQGSQKILTENGEVLVNYTDATLTKYATNNIYLFKLWVEGNSNTWESNQNGIVRMKYCQIYNGSTLIRDFIPCFDDNKIRCLYDKVENKYYYNQGTNSFLGDSDEKETKQLIPRKNSKNIIKGYVGIKEEYKILSHIESTGVQYIDTEVVMTDTKKIEIDFQFTQLTYNTNVAIVGAYNGNDSTGIVLGMKYDTESFQFAYGGQWNGETQAGDLNRHIGYLNYNGQCLLDDVVLATSSDITTSLNSGITIKLLDYGLQTERPFIKIYSCKIWDGDILIRDFIPIKTKTGIVCLYDKITKKKFLSKENGNFIGDDETEEIIEIAKSKKVFSNYKVLKSLGIVNKKQYSLYAGALASTPHYFIMAGGLTTEGGSPQTAVAEVYDIDFLRSVINPITARKNVNAGSIGQYALFLGGYTSASASYNACSTYAEAYDDSLIRYTASALTSKAQSINLAYNDRYLMTFGAPQYSATAKNVDCYDINLVKSTAPDLASTRKSCAGTRAGTYLICAGGSSSTSSSGGQVTTVEAYNKDLTKTTCSGLDTAVHHPCGAWVNGYAMIIGGAQSSESGTPINTINIYDAALVKHTSMNFPVAATQINATTISNGKYAIVGSGRVGTGTYTYPSNYYVYDEDLVLIKTINSGFAGNSHISNWLATIGDIACRYNYGSGVGAIGLIKED